MGDDMIHQQIVKYMEMATYKIKYMQFALNWNKKYK